MNTLVNKAEIVEDMHKVTVILSSDDGTSDAHPNAQQYPIGALRQSSSYLDAMLSRRWSESLEDESDDESAYPVVDLSRLGLDPDACTAVLQFMVSRYYYHVPSGDAKVGRCNDSTQDKQRLEEAIRNEAETKIRKVTLEDIKVLLWSKGDDTIDRGRFQWDEDEKTVDWGAGLLNAQKNENEQSMHCISSQSDNSDEVTVRVWFYSSLRCTEVYVTRIVETWDWRGDSDTGLVSDEFKTHLE